MHLFGQTHTHCQNIPSSLIRSIQSCNRTGVRHGTGFEPEATSVESRVVCGGTITVSKVTSGKHVATAVPRGKWCSNGQRWAQFQAIKICYKLRPCVRNWGGIRTPDLTERPVSVRMSSILWDRDASFSFWCPKRNLVTGEPNDLETILLAEAQLPGPRTCCQSKKWTLQL